ncbi:MAG TPA: hypothetical protein VFK10_19525 [Burkholderiaceae bacterium]|nr:hypothetical protein [Burkholderiaceae bacterium]
MAAGGDGAAQATSNASSTWASDRRINGIGINGIGINSIGSNGSNGIGIVVGESKRLSAVAGDEQ